MIWESRRVNTEIRQILASENSLLNSVKLRSRYVDEIILEIGLQEEKDSQYSGDEKEYESWLKESAQHQYRARIEDSIINALVDLRIHVFY
uniref:Uncharacterized protein n=1 Tax=Syphacia muris TaxID=451379 RepID=A0A0N5AUZ7_9BILA